MDKIIKLNDYRKCDVCKQKTDKKYMVAMLPTAGIWITCSKCMMETVKCMENLKLIDIP